MDVSKNYIEMCKKAQEIQNLIKFSEVKSEVFKSITSPLSILFKFIGFYFYRSSKNKCFICNNTDLYIHINTPEKSENYIDGDIWLPRQDQLQKMIKGDVSEKNLKFNIFLHSPVFQLKTIQNKKVLKEFKEKFENNLKHANNKKIQLFESETKLGIENIFISFEQIWLALVMKENFNKKWNNEKKDWFLIKENNHEN